MMKIVVYSAMKTEESSFARLEKDLGVELCFCSDPPTLENIHLAEGADAISCITTPISGNLIEQIHKLGIRYLSTRSVGYDHIDIQRAKELGVGVGNSSYAPSSVAEYTVMLILMAIRRGGAIVEAFSRQDYSLSGKIGTLLEKSTVGVVGTGQIGSAVIQILRGFGCKILAYDPYPNDRGRELAEYVSLDRLFTMSDIITLHAPATTENYHLINRDTIAQMKSGVVLVNTARGTLIHTEDLIMALQSGKVGFAALDVVEGETPYYYKNFEGKTVDHSGIMTLNSLPNTLLTPHTAFFTKDAVEEVVKNALQSCVLELQGNNNPYRVV